MLWVALGEGRIVFGYGTYAPTDAALTSLPMAHDKLGVLLPREYPLTLRKRIRLRDLVGERLILEPRHLYPSLHADIVAAAPAQDITLSVVWRPVVDLDVRLIDVVTWSATDTKLRIVRALIESARGQSLSHGRSWLKLAVRSKSGR